MAENTIFAAQNISGFAYNSTFGAFWKMVAPSPFDLTEGQEYTVAWDDIEYKRTAFAFTNPADGTACVAVGNKMVTTGVDDGDLFAIVHDQTNNYLHLFSTEQKTDHTVGVYQGIADEPTEPAVGIVLKDFEGTEQVYHVEMVKFNTSDGGTQIFSKGEAVEGVPIALDLADGDQTVTAPAGTLVKSAIIQKPDTLLPENIVKGVEIAGVVGTSDGGGDSNRIPVIYTKRTTNTLAPFYSSTATTKSVSVSVSIPKDAVLLDVICGGGSMQQSNYLYGYPESNVSRKTSYTVTEGDTTRILSYTLYGSVSSRQYISMVAEINAVFSMPGVYLYIEETGAILRFDSTVETYTAGELPLGIPFSLADLSACKIAILGDDIFKEQNALVEVRLPETLTTIGASSFYNCKGLSTIELPSAVTAIGEEAFHSCTALSSIEFPESLTEIGAYAFSGCSNLSGLVFPDGLQNIGTNAFSGCKLGHVTIPRSMTTIGSMAFYSCGITSITIPDSVTIISGSAFSYNSGLTEITLPDSVEEITRSAFQYCSNLSTVNLGNGIKIIGYRSFYYCSGLTSITIPDSVTTLGEGVFYGCSKLTSVTLSANITEIDNSTFRGCSNLSSITIPNGVTSIGTYVFYGCSKLASIVIPPNVTSIGIYAFYNCTSLVTVDLTQCTSVPTLGSSNFNSKPTGFEIKVPASLYDSFIAATNWSSLSSYIVAV